MLPYDSDHLTEPEQATQRLQTRVSCWQCRNLVRRRRSGYRGCDLGHEVAPVIAGEKRCCDWEGK